MKNFTHARAFVCLLTVLLLTGKLYAQQKKKDALKGIVQNEKKNPWREYLLLSKTEPLVLAKQFKPMRKGSLH
ncbi:hypothetical protein [Paraflavitalea speifideaquila]|uniref:hypothetical protein n=1 Tax=Paraflavitalea speifideaquila TaxID=3076558 RepID=UPI0028EF58B2|nr:hypothetical protein [Paraflavitalea speifideiaquila]